MFSGFNNCLTISISVNGLLVHLSSYHLYHSLPITKRRIIVFVVSHRFDHLSNVLVV